MPRLTISLLGPIHIELAGAPVTHFESAKVRALLAYLAVEVDRPHRRESLAAILWPDWPDKAALSNLRYALADLRKNIDDQHAQPPFLLITRDSLQLNPASDYHLDTQDFERLCQTAHATGEESANPQSEIVDLHSAVSLYRGEFLEGFSVPDSPPFEQWVLGIREHCHQLMLAALYRLANAYEAQGEYTQAQACARRQLELESWREEAHQQLMRSLALAGERSAALGQYEVCRRVLQAELGVEPGAETLRVYESIKAGEIATLAAQPAVLPSRLAALPPEAGEPPFKGLQYFDVPDVDLFFGREALTARLVRHIREMSQARTGQEEPGSHGFLAVVGASGSGKSSVVRAGVVPALQRGEILADDTFPPEGCQNWRIYLFTPTAHPLEALSVSLTHAIGSVSDTARLMDDLGSDPRSLHLYVQRLMAPLSSGLAGKPRLLLIVDQFEELFTLCRSETERVSFLNNLMTALQSGESIQVIVVLRSDFYTHCSLYPELRQALSARQEFIGPMDYGELRRAIEEPARRNQWDLEPGLVELVLRDVGAAEDHPPEPGALPLLEHALLETWKRRSGRNLTLKGYAEAGGVHGAIAKTAERVFADLTPTQQVLARRIFLRLTELGEGTQDTRRRATLAELTPGDTDPSGVEELLSKLADARLITLSEGTAEVAHEALIREWSALHQWLREDRDSLRLHRHLTETAGAWSDLGRDPGELYRGARLAQAAEWAEAHPDDLNALEGEFLQTSREQAQQEVTVREAQLQRELEAARILAKTQRQRTTVIFTGLLITIIFAGIAFWFMRLSLINAADAKAERERADQARVSLSFQLTLQSLLHQEEALDLALLLANEAVLTANTSDARSSLFSGLSKYPRLRVLLRSHSTRVVGIAFSEDGKLMVTGSLFGEILVWDSSEPYAPVLLSIQPGSMIQSLALSPDGKTLAIGGSDGFIRLLDLSNPADPSLLGGPFSGHKGPVMSVAFSPDSKLLASGGKDQLINLWDVSNPTAAVRLGGPISGNIGSVHSLDISPDGKVLASGSSDGTILLWDISDPSSPARLGQPLSGHTGRVTSVAFSPDGKLLASGGADHLTRLWDVSDPALPHYFAAPMQHSDEVFSVAFSLDGKRLASASADRTVVLWDVSKPASPVPIGPPLLGHSSAVYSLAFTPDGKGLASGSDDGAIMMWDVSSSNPQLPIGQTLTGHTGVVNSVAFSPDGRLLASGSDDHTVLLWDLSNLDKLISPGQVLTGHTGSVTSVAFSPDSKLLASGSVDWTLRLWDVSNPAAPHSLGDPLSGHKNEVLSVAFNPDGKILASGSADSTIQLWDVSHPRSVIPLGPPLTGHLMAVTSIAFSPDGKTLASGSNDNTIILWDVSNPTAPVQLNKLFSGFYIPVWFVAFHPDGKLLASGNSLYTIQLWDVVDPLNPVRLSDLKIGTGIRLLSAAFSPDGNWLATGSDDNKIYRWDISDPLAPVLLDQPLTGHNAAVNSLAFSPDGQCLASGSADHTIKLWDFRTATWQTLACQIAGRNLTQAEWQKYFLGQPYHQTCPQWEAGK